MLAIKLTTALQYTCLTSSFCFVTFIQMAIENRIRQRLDLQTTRRQQLEFKEQKRQAEKEEEEEFRRKVKASMHCLKNICLLTVSTVKQVEEQLWYASRRGFSFKQTSCTVLCI